MADFTTTTNLSLKKPAIGGSSDKWGEYLNANLDTIDIEIQTLKTASSSRTLESLSNVLNLTPTTGQVLQYGIASWSAATLSIPEDVEDLSNVTVTSPSDGQVLAWSNSNSRWENQTPGAATIPNGSITSAKLSTSLQGQLNLILQTTGTPTDNQILRYDSTSANWEFQDLPGGTISALSDTDVSGISNQDVLVYNSTSGDWVSRPLAIADVSGLQASLDAKLESSDLSVSSLTDTTITTTADNSVLVYDASDSKWKNEGPSTARSSLGLAIGADVQAYDADTTKNDVSNTFSANQIISVSDNSNAALRITQTGSGNALVVEDSANPDSTPFVVDASGSVGIGTSSINAALHVNSTSSSLPFAIFEGGASVLENIALQLVDRGTASGNNNILEFGSVNTNIDRIGIARVRAITQGGNAANGGDLVLETASDDVQTFNSNQIYLDNAGNVGIGTASPAQKLDVSGNINATGALTLGTALAIAEGGTGVTSLGSLNAADLGSGAATDGYVLTADGAGGAAWEAASGGGGGTTAYVEHSSTISDSFTVSSGTNRMYIGGTTFSGTISVAGRLAIVAGPANFTGTINVTGTLATV